jgi:hypothetical protein
MPESIDTAWPRRYEASSVFRISVFLPAAVAFLVSCAIARGGFFSSADPGDVGRYHGFAALMQDGNLPYRDFYFEYPPGAIAAFLAPAALGGTSNYNLAFKVFVAFCGLALLAAVVGILGILNANRLQVGYALGLFVLMPVSLGAVVLNRYDIFPALLVVVALLALLCSRHRSGFALLAVGCAVKIFPAVVLPVAAIHVLRTRGRDELIRVVAVFLGVSVLLFAPFALLAPGGLGYSFYTQIIRKLQLESFGASLLLVADRLGVYKTTIIPGKPGSIDLDGAIPDILGVVTTLVLVGALAVVVVAYLRAAESPELLVAGFAASVAAFVVFSKVISPQFLVWLVPLVPLVAGRPGRLGSLLLLTVLVTTQIEVVYEHPLRAMGWPVWVLLARNLLLVALFVVLLTALNARKEPETSLLDRAAGMPRI